MTTNEKLDLLRKIRENGGEYIEIYENYTREFWEEFVGDGIIIYERHYCRQKGCFPTDAEEWCFIHNCHLSGSIAATLTSKGL